MSWLVGICRNKEQFFINEREDFVAICYNGEYPELYPKVLKSANAQDNKENAQDNKENAQDNKENAQDNKENAILEFCKEPKSLKEIIGFFGYKNARNFREKYIVPLVKEGKMKMTIPDKPTSKNQKYLKQ